MTPSEVFALLAGTYTLLNTTSFFNGQEVPDLPYGENPVGILTYSASGYMSATITATEPEYRPNLTFPYQPDDSDADWAQIGRHSIGYAGPLTLSDAIPATETHGQVFHGPLIVANVPTWVGDKQRRNYTLHEDGVYLQISSDRGNGNTGELWWKRLD